MSGDSFRIQHTNNNLGRGLDFDEHEAIMQAAKILATTLKSNIFQIDIQSTTEDRDNIHSVRFVMDLRDAPRTIGNAGDWRA